MSDLFAPEGGWRVRILDLSGGAEDNIVEEIGGFPTLMHANAFARRYVRDLVERCRVSGMSAKDVLDAWFAFGEDAIVVDAGEGGWRSAAELGTFVDHRAGAEDRDWRSIDPRRMDLDDDDDTIRPGRMTRVRFVAPASGRLRVTGARVALANALFAHSRQRAISPCDCMARTTGSPSDLRGWAWPGMLSATAAITPPRSST